MSTLPPAKRPYTAPALKTYGTLTELTMSVGNSSKNADGGSMSNTKTK